MAGRSGSRVNSFVPFWLAGRLGGLGRGQDQAGLLGLAVGEEGALGALGRHAGGGHVADGGAQRAGVLRLLQVGAVGAAGAAGRDLGHRLDQRAVGADLVPHRDRDRGDQLLLGGVDRAVALRAGPGRARPTRPGSSSGRMPKLRARRPCLSAFMDERALPSGVLGPRFFGAGASARAGAAMVMAAGPAGGELGPA